MVFGPDGDLYVGSQSNQAVLKFDGTTGGFIGAYVTPGEGGLVDPRGLAFDQDGRLYVADLGTSAIHRYDSTGQYLDDPVVGNSTSFPGPAGIIFDTQGRLLISCRDADAVLRYDRGVTASLSETSAVPINVSYATSDISAVAGVDYTGQTGTITFAPGQTSRSILLATHDDSLPEGNETFALQLNNPTGGATIGNGNATVTILDDRLNQAPAITSPDNTFFFVGTTGTFTVTATGSPTPMLTESGALPSDVSFDVATGILSGTPASGTGGTYALSFTASNGVDPVATQNFTLNVNQSSAITSATTRPFLWAQSTRLR